MLGAPKGQVLRLVLRESKELIAVGSVFRFQDPRGQHQRSDCLKALRELEGKGWFQLPASQIEKGGRVHGGCRGH